MSHSPTDDNMPAPLEIARMLGRLLRTHVPEASAHQRMALMDAIIEGYDTTSEEHPWIPIPVVSWNEGEIEETAEDRAERVAEAAQHGISDDELIGIPAENIINGQRIVYVRGGPQLTLSFRPAGDHDATPPTETDHQLVFDKDAEGWEIHNQTTDGESQAIGTLYEEDGFLQMEPVEDD